MTYDTAEIRREARKILRCKNQVSDSAEPKLRSMRGEISDSFRGEAANALNDRLNDIDADVQAICGGLDALYRALLRYADALDEADRRLANTF
jgi:WXG100 family type VII secretion target